ncbi:arylesterase [Maridesulfovibrio salexigens]|uniref:Lipolytic protein G-D-S-L family n=1 Tax=Maridesulfovibrio salexigens (strain ATCC 14822 / DSM 2638 / NCIMB 8403 / VKM B-1763) TaxID=526222 RepID=C6BYT1_MARSD|nr:arylesterase [Maridesulfovibrio salexigens]ACS80688.1 lipolytic protein G-D-S-L family [Maridesulfovibrio salexigens DSM 2638]
MAKITLAAFGDSLTEGYGLPAYSSLPAQLERKLLEEGFHVAINNFGLSGDTSADGLFRLANVIESEPNAAYIEFGANDCFQLMDPEQTKLNLSRMVETFQEANIPVLLLGFKPMNFTPQSYSSEFSSIFNDVADKFGVPLYPSLTEGIGEAPEYYQPDGVHPNSEGVAVMVNNMFPAFKSFLESISG